MTAKQSEYCGALVDLSIRAITCESHQCHGSVDQEVAVQTQTQSYSRKTGHRALKRPREASAWSCQLVAAAMQGAGRTADVRRKAFRWINVDPMTR